MADVSCSTITLVRSAVTLTVSGELDGRIPRIEDEDGDDESETYELLVSFLVDEQEYGLYILDPFFVVARMEDGSGVVEGEDFDRIQPRIEAELDEREPRSDAPSLAAT